jgi:hypothetical protein
MGLVRHESGRWYLILPEVQTGSTTLPILVIPRINGVPVTQTQIKNNFSNVFVSDGTTPLTFTMEYQTRLGTLNTQAYDATLSTDSIIFFPMPDSFYATAIKWTIIPFWNIVGLTQTEKIYANESIMLEVKDLHLGG